MNEFHYDTFVYRSRDKKWDDYHRRAGVSSTSRGLPPPNPTQPRVYPDGRYDGYSNHRERYIKNIYNMIIFSAILFMVINRYPNEHKRDRYDGYNRPYHRERDHRDRDIKRR
jgi:hypothetical protein